MSSESGPEHPVAAGATRSIVVGGVATGVAYGLGLSPQLAGAVGATVIVASGTGEATSALSRRMRGTPGPKEQALRSTIYTYLSTMQERLLASDNNLFKNPTYAQRIREFSDEIGSWDEPLAAALLSLNGALVLNSDFCTANSEPVLRALQRVKDLLEAASAPPTEPTVEKRGVWSQLLRRKRHSKP